MSLFNLRPFVILFRRQYKCLLCVLVCVLNRRVYCSVLVSPLLQQKIFLIFAKIFRLVYGDKDFIEGGGYMTAHSQIDAFTYLVAKVYSLNQLRVEQTGAVGDGARALINVVFYHLLTNIIEL